MNQAESAKPRRGECRGRTPKNRGAVSDRGTHEADVAEFFE